MFEYWQKQTAENPLHPEIEWEKPERKDMAGKLLIIGGSSLSFSGVADAYSISKKAGIGEVKTILPESLRKITKDLPDILYAPANTSGSFSVKSKDVLLYASQWADGVLLSGEYGRNSESAIAISNLIESYSGTIVLAKDSIELVNSEMTYISKRPRTVIVCSYSQLQKLAKELNDQTPFKYSDDLTQVVKHLHQFTIDNSFGVITKHGDYLIASHSGEVVTINRTDLNELWCLKLSAIVSVNCIQHSKKTMAALADSLLKNFTNVE